MQLEQKYIDANKKARELRNILTGEAQLTPTGWAALLLWSPKTKKIWAIPSWKSSEDVAAEIHGAIVGEEGYTEDRGNVAIYRTRACAPDVPLAIIYLVAEDRMFFAPLPDAPSPLPHKKLINLAEKCLHELCDRVEEMQQQRKEAEERQRPLLPGEELMSDDACQKCRVLKVSGEWASVQCGEQKPIRRKVLVDCLGPYISVGGKSLYRYFVELEVWTNQAAPVIGCRPRA